MKKEKSAGRRPEAGNGRTGMNGTAEGDRRTVVNGTAEGNRRQAESRKAVRRLAAGAVLAVTFALATAMLPPVAHVTRRF